MKKITTLLLLLGYTLTAQVTGTVTDEKGSNLPYVSVYLENAAIGTTTNDNGHYELNVRKGKQTVVFQFLGYKTVKKEIDIETQPYTLDMQLQPQEVVLDEVQISSNENPANQIIRNAIAAKEKNSKHLNNYTADFYSKGVFRVKNAPEKFLGQKINFPFPLDSTRSGIIYLSETVSKIKSQKKPKKFNERIIASKVSGQDNGISFNQADEVNFNLYENTITIDVTEVISPIANYAFGHYNYKLTGSFYNNNGHLINKIQLLPKREGDRVFSGHIYIVEDIWAIYGAALTINGKQLNNPAIKELVIKQNYKYLPKYKAWNLILQTIDFKAGMFSFNVNGQFSASYSHYNLSPKFSKKTFTNEILSFEKEATKKDSVYWNKLRPMPLTLEEKKDYSFKDSIKILKKSKKYLDSVDVKKNRFNLTDIIFGYNYQNSYEKWNAGFNSPIEELAFNTVQGWNTSLSGYFTKELNKFGKWYHINADVNYGFSDEKWRPTASFTYKWNNIDKPLLQFSGGVKTSQFNSRRPISRLYNTIFSLLFEENFMKIYEKTFAKVKFERDLTNGLRIFSEVEYAHRKPLKNTTDFTLIDYKDREYTSNNPIDTQNEGLFFKKHTVIGTELTAKFQFGNQYLMLPNSKVNLGNRKYPTLYVTYRNITGVDNRKLSSNLFLAKIQQSFDVSNLGEFSYEVKGGIFTNKRNIPFIDYLHPTGNRLPLVKVNSRVTDYGLLDYYTLSSNDKQSEWHVEHNFKGFILSRIPLIRKLNFHLVTGAKALFTGGIKPYTEYSIGIDNVGYGKWRFFRIDYVRSNYNGIQNDGIVFWFRLF